MIDPGASQSTSPPPPPDRRVLGIVLGLVATALLATAAFSPRWLANDNGSLFDAASLYSEVRFSLRSYTACTRDDCIHVGNAAYAEIAMSTSDAHDVSAAFAPCGWITFGACLLGALGLLISALLALARRHPTWPISPTTIAFLAAGLGLITGCVFIATKPGAAGFVGVAWGFWVFGAGVIAALGGSMVLARVIRPIDDDLMADSMNPDDF